MSPAWQVAASLDVLLDQLNALAPGRSRASDGSIGDAAHASRSSDHNPWWTFTGQAYVTARDFTHDPAHGLDCARLATALEHGRDQRVKYAIWNRRIMSGNDGSSPWVWRPYSGTNPHTKHLHLSVVADARSLSRIPWLLPGLTGPAVPPNPAPQENDMPLNADDLRQIREVVKDEVAKVRGLVWEAAIPDYYQPADPKTGQHPPMPAYAALGYGTAHAAHSRDSADHAADQADAIANRLATQPGGVPPDYDAFIRTFAAELLNRLP